MRRLVISCLFLASACAMPRTAVLIPGVSTKIEKTTVTVRDPDGKVLRVEEKEMVLQDYAAGEPVKLQTVDAPRLPKIVRKTPDGTVASAKEAGQ